MERRLGRTDLNVNVIGHGLWGMGSWSGGSDDASMAALEESVARGCNFFDTAWAYGQGKSDRMLGTLLAAHPGRALVAASKVPPKNLKWPSDPRDRFDEVFPETHVREFVGRIREALGGRPVDLLQLHVWEDAWLDHPEFARTVESLKREGAIRWFGLSLNRWQPWNGIRAVNSGLVDVVQVIHNVFDQAPEDELFPACRAADVGVIARVPLDEGSLGGALTRDTRFPDTDWRAGYFKPENLAATLDRVDAIRGDLPAGLSLPEAALRFILGAPEVSTIIVGMRTVEHVRENVAIGDRGPLPADLRSKLRRHRWDRGERAKAG
jgi:aryl-alcohol dehydrogenase-like predicted oxidoreductase